MRVNEAVVDRLVGNDIDTVFGIPGKQSLPLNEAIGSRADIDFVVARHETAVSHQAWAYAETGGGMAATVVIPGPGDMNAMNGLKNALNDCTPLLHVAIETDPDLRGGDGIHETPPDTYDNVVKENIVVQNPESTLAELDRAVDIAQTAPNGPVRLGIPKNFLKMDVPLAERGDAPERPVLEPDAASVDAAVGALADAADPVILAGGGVRSANASDALLAVAERLDAPVVTTYKGKGVIPGDHELYAGTLSGSASPDLLALLADADALLGVATDFDAVATRGHSVDLPDALVHVTLDEGDLGQAYEPTVGIVADADRTLRALDDGLAAVTLASAGGRERAQAARDAFAEQVSDLRAQTDPMTSVAALATVRDALPRETVVSVDAGGFRVWALNTFDAYGPRSYVNPGSWATMGTGVPGAIGAALANPDDPVVALTGDGGLMMCVHELHTAVSEDIPITVVVFNNDDYAIISEEAGRSYDLSPGEYSWQDTHLDFTTIAAGMGMTAVRATSPDELEDALDTGLAADEPVLIEVPTDPEEPQAGEYMGNVGRSEDA
ncbi:thiamine pyrophosphate-binding protein [Halocalculus aciditolerans]|uniref:Acetolactate synthase n=1 Tax=Halocalculus aciditolerans TaxID=1383812 RepID=A0A830F620_9EURY|nr:thiamine pyrophosphate-binding protein [Halocalculus aciditolerans]GGL66596.1 acetolactate synthase [Halocalculus aciditolerans]